MNGSKLPRSSLFGRKDFLEVYRQAKDFIIRYKLLRICRFSEENGLKRLTICNLWRIDREEDGVLHTFEFDLHKAEWLETEDLRNWPAIPFAPIGKNTLSLSWGLSLCRDALQAAICAAGADNLPDEGENGVPSWVRQAIFRKYLGGDAWSRKKHKVYKVNGLIAKTSMDSGARTLRAIWWNHFVDRDVLSALLGITWRQWTVAKYLKYARYRPALLKVAAEHRNLLPVLMEINPQQWGRDDLFSRKLWVRDGRKSTALDRRPVRSEDGDRIRSFESATSWRWLSRASSLIVREWAAVKNNAVIEDLALANCGGIHAPVCAYVKLIRFANRTEFPNDSPLVRRFYRVFLKHCAWIWKERSFSDVRQWLRNPESDLTLMSDYLHAEGFAQGLPDKNSSWASLLRRSEDWHRRIRILNMEREGRFLRWGSIIPETVIDGVICTPLTNSQALAEEGYEMSHCVGSYAQLCHDGIYRVFALKEPDGARSTLGIRLRRKGVITLDQHRGPHNSQVSPKASAAARKLLNACRQALAAKLES